MARIVRHDHELKSSATECVVAALLHDVGMLRVSPETLASSEPLSSDARSVVESHTTYGAELIQNWLPDVEWLTEAAHSHHERLKGTGYPRGTREVQLSPMTRLLAVCDVYAACSASRPHREAREARSALASTLLLADQEQLDRQKAELLLYLSFYPIGTVIEMADGAVGVVIAAPGNITDLQAPARPVVALLTDSEKTALVQTALSGPRPL